VAIYEIARVDLADEVLFQDVVDVWVSMDGEDVPIGLDAAAYGAENHIAAGVVWHPICDVVDTVAAVYPVAFRLAIVVIDLVESEESSLGILVFFVVVVSRWRFSERFATKLSQSEASC
jgi:hypothetical protein